MTRTSALAACCTLAVLAAAPQAHPACVQGWDITPTANPSKTGDNILKDVAGVAGNNIWAVGQYAPDSNPNVVQTLIEHWNGTAWSAVPSPDQTRQGNALLSVTVASSGEAWATGYATDPVTFYPHSLIEHWDGAGWRVVSHPAPGISDHLFAVTAISPRDVWAVGTVQYVFGHPFTLVEHFDGIRWSVVDAPNPGLTSNVLYAVTARGSDDVWVAGQRTDRAGADRALVMHWTGKAWSVVGVPHPAGSNTALYAIKPDGDAAVAGVGEAQDDLDGRTFPLAEEGEPLGIAPVQLTGRGDLQLYGLSITAAGAWAVGSVTDWSTGNPNTLAVHRARAGVGWRIVATPNPAAGGSNQLGGVAEIGGTTWVVGAHDGPNAAVTLAMRRCD